MKSGIKTIVAIAAIVTLSCLKTYAQPPPNEVPLDPISWTVLGAGAAIAGKKYYNKKFGKKE